MSTSESCEVLVVGAGPTGLTLAACLTRLGVRVRVIDKNAARSDQSKAIGVQAGSLEALGQFFGDAMPQQMIAAGKPAREGFIHIGRRAPVRLDLSLIPSTFNFVLILAQSETERFLEEDLEQHGVSVRRQTEAIAVEDAGSRVVARLQDVRGNVEQVVADYVVGCDGAHSVVRHCMNIPYAGSSYEGDFLLGDVTLSPPWPREAIRVFLSDRGVLACFPMKGEAGFYRLILASTVQSVGDPSEISPAEFCTIVESLSPEPIAIAHFKWLTRFRLHHRMAQHFRSGRAFLAGDAAHIHSPVGGQGMNTGIQDALNVGSKLAAVLQGRADVSLLDQYEKERLPVAHAVVRGTDWGFRFVLGSQGGPLRLLGSALIPRLLGSRWVQKKLVRTVSQVDVARREMRNRANAAR